jgi:cytoplasmic iron level regulating protein YaaA (DUF328/UPF0246 family)
MWPYLWSKTAMLVLISPAKTLDFDCDSHSQLASVPVFLTEAEELVNKMRGFSAQRLEKLMGISGNLARLNVERFTSWQPIHTEQNCKPAILAFQGDVYQGMEASQFTPEDLDFAQGRLRILSGLYGLLRPMDQIQPYRLEMGTRIKIGRKKDLYHFWSDKITRLLNQHLEESKSGTLINLASQEYFGAVDVSKLAVPVVKPVFLDGKAGQYKVVSYWAKRARGMMAAFILQNRIQDPEQIKGFDAGGYSFSGESSTSLEWVFRRHHQS